MKSKLLSTFSMLRVLMVAALTVFCVSCDKTETTDSTGFVLHYLGVTDIGPSMTYTLKAPAYKGGAPYDFTITKITLDEETFSNDDNFVINAETGEITIQNTDAMASGLYSISIGCYSNGKFFDFKDAVQVNMLLARPEGLTVEPAEVLVNQDEEKWVEASAQVTTEKDKHISILGYSIAQDESRPYLQYFDITTEGKIIIKEGTTEQQLVAGESYTLSLKLTTKVGDHMFDDAVTFKVVSKPKDLVYDVTMPELAEVAIEFNSAIPTIGGGKEGLKFAIQSVTPETDEFTIDEITGQIHLAEGHSLPGNDDIPYVFNITVSNSYGIKTFENAYSVTVTNYIAPIDPNTFSYPSIGNSIYQQGGDLTQTTTGPVTGDRILFALDDANSDEVKAQAEAGALVIDRDNGTVTIKTNHTFTATTHDIKVIATNPKTEKGGPAGYATLQIEVKKNPNDFTYVSWGTNLEQPIITKENNRDEPIITKCEEAKNINYRNQFRFIHNRDIRDIIVQSHDNTEGSTFTYKVLTDDQHYIGNTDLKAGLTVNPTNGTIQFRKMANGNLADADNKKSSSSYIGAIFLIEVTASGHNAPPVTRKIPIFINTPKIEQKPTSATSGNVPHTIICTPFVVRANPKTGVCEPFKYQVYQINATQDTQDNNIQKNYSRAIISTTQLVWDYVTEFSYCNFDENSQHASGKQTIEGSMLNQVWRNCGISTMTNNGPLRYYDGSGNKDTNGTKAGYIDARNHQLFINNNVWKGNDGKYPYGAMLGQMRFNVQGNSEDLIPKDNSDTNVNKVSVNTYPIFIWFDETYEGN